MKLFINAIALILGLTLATNGYSKTKTTPVKPSDVVIEGVVLDAELASKPEYQTTVTVNISKYPFTAVEMVSSNNKKYEIKCNYGKKFKISIDMLPADLCYMQIYFTTPGPGIHWDSIDNIYLLQKGDRIQCKLTNNFFEFSGKGGAKLQCQSEIYKKNYRLDDGDITLIKTKQYGVLVKGIFHKIDSCLNVQKKIVEQYKTSLGPKLSSILLANCYGLAYYSQIRSFRAMMGNDNIYMVFKESKGFTGINLDGLKGIDPVCLAASPAYTSFLFEKLLMEVKPVKEGKVDLDISKAYMKDVYTFIVNNYKGILRDKLLAIFFINYSPEMPIQDYLEQAIRLVRTKDYKDILMEIKRTRLDGLPFYPFELEDFNGHKVKLADFKNKVVLVDFWYTGCSGCTLLYEAMAPVREKFKNNPSVVFLSISIDKEVEKWKKSVTSGIYTDADGVNLYTGGLGDKHPLIRNYHIAAYPQLFVLKNGDIFSSNPPWPLLDQDRKPVLEGSTTELINLIEDAISKL